MKDPAVKRKTKDSEQYSKELVLGILLTIAILDHTRLFFHYWNTNPGNLESTTPLLFFTRFISHFFAPTVFFITGTYLFIWSKAKSKRQVCYGLLRLALLLISTELVVNNFLWTFDPFYRTIGLFIIGALGLSIGLLAFLQFLPEKFLLVLSLLFLIAHHLLDGIPVTGKSPASVIWYILHQQKYIPSGEYLFIVNYTIIPWFALLSLGYTTGYLYRRKWLLATGIVLTCLFFILRGMNWYGDPKPWIRQETFTKTVLSFFSVTKYPASLDFICITLGPMFIVLHCIEGLQNKLTDFFVTFGSAPMFTYLLSTLVIHLAAMINMELTGGSWSALLITPDSYQQGNVLSDYGYPLGTVYLLWLLFLFMLYGCCKFYHSFSSKRTV
ncbi:DUF1624 domain-containing protein [Pedobacter hartonius]|uniref:Uncharacterized membrane protein n=1 Tax=Pedobacter hartonius TaxID=425514 RepID=A0A1H3XPI4_9SPHI|nr:hypothetical protein [Pedobacter hartonius]SEA00514.1 Uncharacterized membrane protein [Pedobacter hartonius]